MTRSANSAFGATGLAAFAVSAVDLALWDLKGKLLGVPTYELLGGPARDRTRCYATGNDLDDLRDRGFEAFKLACTVGPAAATAGIEETERLVAGARSELGPDADIMLDCWPVLDASYAVRLGEALAPYRLTWIEDYAQPDDWPGYADVRRRLPGQMLAAGERWHTARTFAHAAEQRLVDVLQPDVQWVGGATAVLKIAAIAAAAGLELAVHGGCNDAYGQHLCHGLPGNRWGGDVRGLRARRITDGRLALHPWHGPAQRRLAGAQRRARLRHRRDPRPARSRRRLSALLLRRAFLPSEQEDAICRGPAAPRPDRAGQSTIATPAATSSSRAAAELSEATPAQCATRTDVSNPAAAASSAVARTQ